MKTFIKNNYIKIILSVLFLVSAAISNAGMDVLSHHYSESFASDWNEQFWNPAISWTNKYIDNDYTKGRIRWLFFGKPAAFTDAWHLIKMFMILFIVLSIVIWIKGKLYLRIIYVAIGGFLWSGGFEIFYSKILRKRKE